MQNSKNFSSLGWLIVSFVIVAFGQPYWSLTTSFFASFVGFAFFFKYLLQFDSPKKRFWIASFWFTAVQLVQLSWFLSHPYLYIIIVHVLLSFILGLQFGIIGFLADPKIITTIPRILLICGSWTLIEWSRLFVLSGFAFNPIGMSLSANLYTLQMASIGGVFGLSFWVLLTNLLALKSYLEKTKIAFYLFLFAFAFPFLFGFIQLKKDNTTKNYNVLLVQPVFPIEETLTFTTGQDYIKFVEEEWQKILTLLKPHLDKKVELIVLPEFIVPFGTYTPLFDYQKVIQIVKKEFGQDALHKLPTFKEPLGVFYNQQRLVSNAYWLQAISNIFQADVIAGMEDAEEVSLNKKEYYSAAQYVEPLQKNEPPKAFQRYAKRILVPMGEYIPFSFCRSLAASYGITGSFTPGEEAKIFSKNVPFGASICYEETFGHIMRENRLKGAEVLVNMTNDAWYPTVAWQHCHHAILRTVENGMPLVRSCNTGITAGFDSHGRLLKVVGDTFTENITKAEALFIEVPISNYSTIYTFFGDYLIVFVSIVSVCMGLWYKNRSFSC